MSNQLYACIHAAEFPAQALLRLRPDLQSQPVAVLEGRAPLEAVCAMNNHARQKGAALGMTRLETEAMGDLHLLARSSEGEAVARGVLLECAASFSPRLEDASKGTAFTCVLDIAGTERLFGPAANLAQRLRSALGAAGFRVSLAVSNNFHVARMKAASSRGISVIAEGEEVNALARLSVGLLPLATDHAQTLELWGIRTLGELAALPEVELIARLGQGAKQGRNLALGVHPHSFQPIEAEFQLKEFYEFDTPVEEVDSLLFVGARMMDCLVARAASRALSLASLTVHMQLGGGRVHRRVIRPALPSVDRKFLLKLLQLEIAAHPPQASVIALTMTAEPGQSSKVQLGLFAPQTPEPSRLDVTIARLKAIAGEDRVGSPILEDSHRPGSFHMEGFVAGEPVNRDVSHTRIALRRMRPAIPVRVVLRADAPAIFHDGKLSYLVSTAFGPWKNNGCWWSIGGWDTDEWDVLAQPDGGTPVACVLVLDRSLNEWKLEAFYD